MTEKLEDNDDKLAQQMLDIANRDGQVAEVYSLFGLETEALEHWPATLELPGESINQTPAVKSIRTQVYNREFLRKYSNIEPAHEHPPKVLLKHAFMAFKDQVKESKSISRQALRAMALPFITVAKGIAIMTGKALIGIGKAREAAGTLMYTLNAAFGTKEYYGAKDKYTSQGTEIKALGKQLIDNTMKTKIFPPTKVENNIQAYKEVHALYHKKGNSRSR